MSVKSFLNPDSVVVVGVSRDPIKIGRIIFEQLKLSSSKVFGINPKYDGDKRIFKEFSDLTIIPDLAIYTIPSDFIYDALLKACLFGIKNHLIISSGFAETGSTGIEKENRLKELIRKFNIRIQGPNCLGNISPANHLNISFGIMPKKGNIGLILQSGAVGTSFLDWSDKHHFGVSHFVSLGNKMDLSETEFLEFLEKDNQTKAIGLYLESIKNPLDFLKTASRVSLKKPVVVLMAGKSKESTIAISSHTGALATSYAAHDAAFRQNNILHADTLEEFFLLLDILSKNKNLNFYKKTMILTNAGGPSVLTVDLLAQNNFPLYKFPKTLTKRLASKLPANSSLLNPVDLLGDADSRRFKIILDALPNLPYLTLFIILTPQENTDFKKIFHVLIDFKKKFKGLLIVNLIGGKIVDIHKKILEQNKILVFTFLDEVIAALVKLRNRFDRTDNINRVSFGKILVTNQDRKHIDAVLQKRNSQFLPEQDVISICQIYKFPIPKYQFISSESDLLKHISRFNYPVVLKASSKEIVHRNKSGGVFINLINRNAVLNSYHALSSLKTSVLLQEMIAHEVEIIIGAKRNSDYQYLLMFGSGGIHTEYLKDVSFGVLSGFDKAAMLNMLCNTKIFKLIKNPLIFEGIFRSLISLLNDFPVIEEVDLNPVVIDQKGKLSCVDIKISV